MRFLTLLPRVLLLCVLLLMQSSGARAQGIQRQNWTTEDGLPQNSVHALLQSADGFLWLATEGGAARFDGIHFDRYTAENTPAFPSNDLCCIAEAEDGALYFGTSDGVVRLLRGRFERLPRLRGAIITMQRQGDGVLLLAADGLYSLAGLESRRLSLPDGLEAGALGHDPEGHALVAAGNLLLRWSGGGWKRDRSLPAAPVELLEEKGSVWFRTTSAVYLLQPGGNVQWQIGRELPGTRIASLFVTAGGVHAATNRGVYRLERGRLERGAAVPDAQIQGVSVLSALTDREGDRWFGTDSSGLVMLRPRAIQSVAALENETITCLVQTTDGVLWLGTRDGGLRTWKDGVVTTPAASNRLASQVVLALAPALHDGLWVGTPEGLDHVTSAGVQHLSSADGLPDDFVRSLLADQDGTVWVGTRRGVAHLRNGKVERVLTRADGLPSDVIGTMLRTRDRALWIGTLSGLVRLQAGTEQVDRSTRSLQGHTVTALAETGDGALWVGLLDGGLAVRRGDRFDSVSTSVRREPIHAVLPDDFGRLWLRTSAGLAQTTVAAMEACEGAAQCEAAVRNYGAVDGMSSVDTSYAGHPAAWRGTDGTLWFASRRGASRIDAAHLPFDPLPPPVAIEQVLLDDVSVPFADGLRIAAGHRRLEVSYAGLSLRAPGQVTYRFRLEGFDRAWTDAGSRRMAEYTNLPFGTYRLLIEARNGDGVVSAAPAVLSIRIDPPFYRRWPFYGLVLLMLATVVYGAYRLRLRRVRREFGAVLGERNRIAREIHDTLAQDFVAVSLQLEVTSQLLQRGKADAAREQVDATRLLVRDGIRDARESIWALRAGESEGTLPARLHAMVNASETPESRASLSVTGAYRALAPSVEKETLRIAKEAFGNAARHAHAKAIQVRLLYSEDAVTVQVSDDGAGFDPAEGTARAGHYGLRGMQERARGIGGTLTVESAPGSGTSVSLILHS